MAFFTIHLHFSNWPSQQASSNTYWAFHEFRSTFAQVAANVWKTQTEVLENRKSARIEGLKIHSHKSNYSGLSLEATSRFPWLRTLHALYLAFLEGFCTVLGSSDERSPSHWRPRLLRSVDAFEFELAAQQRPFFRHQTRGESIDSRTPSVCCQELYFQTAATAVFSLEFIGDSSHTKSAWRMVYKSHILEWWELSGKV